jgi:7-cyano-7-deazaguanine synthase in queuosine biosynthesis
MWHVLVRIGADDKFEADISASDPRISFGLYRTDDPWPIGNNILERIVVDTGRLPSKEFVDLAHLAAAVYSADLRVPRRFGGADRWQRDFVLDVPVHDVGRWQGISPHLSSMLSYLTGDTWQFHFREVGPFPLPEPKKRAKPKLENGCDCVSLFSGGIDSLVGALDIVNTGKRVALVGHHGTGMTQPAQTKVLEVLKPKIGGAIFDLLFYVHPKKDKLEGEPSMRSRSFLFLALGAATASAIGSDSPFVVPENGVISLNVPLTFARMGSHATRTTHPYFICSFASLITDLGSTTSIANPYQFLTKGEMLKAVSDQTLLEAVVRCSMSCSHSEVARFHGAHPGTHCGYCVPCIIRRASTKAANITDAPYDIDVITSSPTGDKSSDLRGFEMAIERLSNAPSGNLRADVLSNGPLKSENIRAFVDVYRRGMAEVASFLSERKRL